MKWPFTDFCSQNSPKQQFQIWIFKGMACHMWIIFSFWCMTLITWIIMVLNQIYQKFVNGPQINFFRVDTTKCFQLNMKFFKLFCLWLKKNESFKKFKEMKYWNARREGTKIVRRLSPCNFLHCFLLIAQIKTHLEKFYKFSGLLCKNKLKCAYVFLM